MLQVDESVGGVSYGRDGADLVGAGGRRLRTQMSRVQREALMKYRIMDTLDPGDGDASHDSLSISAVAKARIRAMKVRRGLSLQAMREKRGKVPASYLLKCVPLL